MTTDANQDRDVQVPQKPEHGAFVPSRTRSAKQRLFTILAQTALIIAFVIITLIMWLPAIVSHKP